MQNFLSLGYMLRVLLAVSANFPDNPRIRGLSVKFVDTANKTRFVYHRLMKFCMNKNHLSGTMKTQYDSLFLNID